MEQKGIKELSEAIEGLAVVYAFQKEVLADSKINLSDIAIAAKYKDELPVLVAAVQGVNEIGAEVKDISGDEAIALIQLLVSKLKAV